MKSYINKRKHIIIVRAIGCIVQGWYLPHINNVTVSLKQGGYECCPPNLIILLDHSPFLMVRLLVHSVRQRVRSGQLGT